MVVFYVILALLAAAATFVVYKTGSHRIGWAITLVVTLLAPLPVYAIVMSIAKEQKQTYHEYWNGYETSAYTTVTACEKDGSCSNHYDCDPYTEVYWETVYDDDGESHQELRTRTVYHSCPYSTEETSYYIDSTLDNYTIASSLMTGTEWDASVAIPGGRVTQPPALWQEAFDRIAAGTPGGVTKVNDYKNFILSSDTTVLKRYSDKIEDYLAKGLLPAPAAGVTDFYKANKAAFAGNTLDIDQSRINEDLMYLNGAVGSDVRGDIRLVFVQAKGIGEPTDYGNSLMAYWQSDQFGRDAIAKNSIVIVVGVDSYKFVKPVVSEVVTDPTSEPTDSTTATPAPPLEQEPVVEEPQPLYPNGTPIASWVKAYTGMPLGNEQMLQQLSVDLEGLAINDDFIGRPTLDIAGDKTIHSNGAIENIIFGENKFVRVSMESGDEGDEGIGFKYLSDAWEPSTENWIWFYVISGVVSVLLGGIGFAISFNYREDYDRRSYGW